MIRLSSLLDSLGTTVVSPTASARRDDVTDVVLADDGGPEPEGCAQLVLGPGIHGTSRAIELLRRAARAHSCAVVLSAPTASHPVVVDAAESLGVGVVELQPTTSWTQLVWLIRSIIDRSTAFADSAVHDEPVDYDALFALADAAAAIVGAPVTIEDVHSRVLAYSELQDRTDAARISTIVGRRVPESVVRHLRSRGAFRQLHSCDDPIRIEAGPEGFLPRLVVPIRAGRELLGSIWALDPEPLSGDRTSELTRTASAVALHLVRSRAQSGIARRLTADRIRVLLLSPDGSTTVPLPPGPWRVVVLWDVQGRGGDQQLVQWELILRRHGWLQPLLTTLDGLPVAVVADSGSSAVAGSWEWMKAVVPAAGPRARALAGAPAHSPAELPRSSTEAMELAPLAQEGHIADSSTTFEGAWTDLVLARARSALLAMPFHVGWVQVLIDHDRERGSALVATLATYLDHYGEPKRAARELHVHPNTLRYRMKQIVDLSGLDFSDHRVRLAAALVLSAITTTARGHRRGRAHQPVAADRPARQARVR
ncbi:PucR family transcriptional regulator [Rhodococcus sp. ACT016]|uniref:PucR family transcriptional regulator n=1 Tax=Rhodococcus sp. ACT016 TaxID=3134808 RepID=UPI003D2E284D